MGHAEHQLRRVSALIFAGCPPRVAIRLEHFWQSAELNGWDTIPDAIVKQLAQYIPVAEQE